MDQDTGIILVRQFHRAFGMRHAERPEIDPEDRETHINQIEFFARQMVDLAAQIKMAALDAGGKSTLLLRLQLIQEELSELAEAMVHDDIVEALDAMADLSYVVDGTYISLGLDRLKLEAIREVHRSNMSKLDANGRPMISGAGRVMKSELYSPPDLRALLERSAK